MSLVIAEQGEPVLLCCGNSLYSFVITATIAANVCVHVGNACIIAGLHIATVDQSQSLHHCSSDCD